MANKKTTKKKSTKKPTQSRLKVAGKTSATTTSEKSSSSKTLAKFKKKSASGKVSTKNIAKKNSTPKKTASKSIEVNPDLSLFLKPLNKTQDQSNSQPLINSKKAKKSLAIKNKLKCSQMVACLEDLIASLKKRTLCIKQGDEFINLNPGSTAEFEVHASVKKGKERLTLKMTWRSEKTEEGAGLRILSSEPVDALTTI